MGARVAVVVVVDLEDNDFVVLYLVDYDQHIAHVQMAVVVVVVDIVDAFVVVDCNCYFDSKI